jgi:hypothetical protein
MMHIVPLNRPDSMARMEASTGLVDFGEIVHKEKDMLDNRTSFSQHRVMQHCSNMARSMAR